MVTVLGVKNGRLSRQIEMESKVALCSVRLCSGRSHAIFDEPVWHIKLFGFGICCALRNVVCRSEFSKTNGKSVDWSGPRMYDKISFEFRIISWGYTHQPAPDVTSHTCCDPIKSESANLTLPQSPQ